MTTDSSVQSSHYNTASGALRREIALLQERAYGPGEPPGDGHVPPLHDPRLRAQSFYMRVDGRMVSYAAVVTTTLRCGHQTFVASGLSCVATDPAYQRQGLATLVVSAATEHLVRSGIDLGVFTCAPELAGFYAGAGGWSVAPEAVLIGSRANGALTSTALGVVVLLRLLSARAQAAEELLRRGTLDLGLPVGEFW